MANAKKELKEIVKAAEQRGWRVKTTKKGHLMFFAPDGVNKVTAGGTPSDHRGVNNLLAEQGATVSTGRDGEREHERHDLPGLAP